MCWHSVSVFSDNERENLNANCKNFEFRAIGVCFFIGLPLNEYRNILIEWFKLLFINFNNDFKQIVLLWPLFLVVPIFKNLELNEVVNSLYTFKRLSWSYQNFWIEKLFLNFFWCSRKNWLYLMQFFSLWIYQHDGVTI